MSELSFDPIAHEAALEAAEAYLAGEMGSKLMFKKDAGGRAVRYSAADMQPQPQQLQQARAHNGERQRTAVRDKDLLDMSTSSLGVTEEDIYGPQGKLG